jgi:hypothetical protein
MSPLEESAAGFIPTWHSSDAVAVPYDTAVEFVRTVAEGATLTAELMNDHATSCPSTKTALSEYSKGALVIHRASLSRGCH